MFSDFMQDNPVACKILSNQIRKNIISHAYIIETNNYYRGYDFALAFAKTILCPKKNIDNNSCNDCLLCSQIDDNCCTELEIIEPDGLWIKKDQLNGLQKKFATKAVNSSNKVYIINQAEKMNDSASNSILKFLEEPEEHIVAILVVSNSENILETISSRCQKIKLMNHINLPGDNDIERLFNYISSINSKMSELLKMEQFINLYELTKKFLESVEKRTKETLLRENNICALILKDKYLFQQFLNILIVIYNDSLNYKVLGVKKVIKNDNIIELLTNNNNIDQISKKINYVLNIQERLKSNCNLNLMLDKLILELEGDL